jgi:CRISPR-associated endonuclease Csn1
MRILGLDIGIASIGFALVEIDLELRQGQIERVGVHLFDTPEQPKTGASLALPRRLARQARRVIRRRAGRMTSLRGLFNAHGLTFFPKQLDEATIQEMSGQSAEPSPWQLRAEALERALSDREAARVLYHIAKHRGFQSTKKGESNDKTSDSGKLLTQARQVREALAASGLATIGAYFYHHKLALGKKVRNGNEDYSNSILRDLHREEIRILWERQQALGANWATDALLDAYMEIAFTQKPLKSVKDKVGRCELEKGEPRAPRYSRSAELFVLWQKINHLRIANPEGTEEPLSEAQRQQAFQLAHRLKTVSYTQLRKELGLADEDTFKGLLYTWPRKSKVAAEDRTWEALQAEVEKQKFIELGGYHILKGILDELPPASALNLWDGVAEILSFEQDVREIERRLRDEWGEQLSLAQLEALLKIDSFKGTVQHSVKAIRNLLPHLEAGHRYDEAVEQAGYRQDEGNQQEKLPPFEKTNNPVVNRALAQTRKIVNAVIREHGMPDRIHVELARETTRNFQDRRELHKRQDENRSENERLKTEAEKEFGQAVDAFKYKLWKEQNRACLYCGKSIRPEELADGTATQIDHALPYSRSFDNSYFNRVLVCMDDNQKKKDKTVWEYFQHEKNMPEDWDRLLARISYLPKEKRDRITFQGKDLDGWKDRHLNDTRWITRMVKNHLERHLALKGTGKQKVLALNGSVTAYLRHQWGLNKDRDKDARHHGQDAIVIACATVKNVQQVARIAKEKAHPQHKRERWQAQQPWDGFRDDVIAKVNQIFVSRMPRRKVSGEIAGPNPSRLGLHPETGQQVVIERIALTSLDEKKLERLVGKEQENRPLYEALKFQLAAFGGKGDKAFKPKDGKPFEWNGIPIYKVSLWGGAESGRELRGGLVSNGDQVRVDVFEKDGRFYLCPVYAWHCLTGELPNQVIKAYTAEAEWPFLDETYKFKFSLYGNDFVRTMNARGEVVEGYYVGVDRSTAAITVRSHDNGQPDSRIGVQRLKQFEKYHIDFFGRRSLVKKETRLELANGSHATTRKPEPSPGTAGLP